MTFQVSKMDLTTYLAQLVSTLEGKNMFLNFWTLLLKMHILRLWLFFSMPVGYPISFSVVVHIYKICIFDEVFLLLTIRVPSITKFFRVVTCCKDLSPIYMYDISTEWSCRVTWDIKYISLPEEDVSIPH